MRKSNFILTEKNYKVFQNALMKMIQRYGCVKEVAKYTGSQQWNGIMKRLGIRNPFLSNVVHTSKTYYLPSITFHLREDGLTISISKHSGNFIPFGTRMYITDRKIQYASVLMSLGRGSSPKGKIDTMVPYADIDRANRSIKRNNDYADDYYAQVDAEHEKEMERMFDMDMGIDEGRYGDMY